MSDTDYINEHMGGFDSDGLPNFLSTGSGEGGMDGYGDVDYAFYHSNARGLFSLLFAIQMTREAVKLLPYYLDDDHPDGMAAYSPKLVGIADGWNDIYNVFREAQNLLLGAKVNHSDYFIFIHPEKEILEVTCIGKQESKSKPSTVELHISPPPEVDANKWHLGLVSALDTFNENFNGYYNGSVSRLTKDQFDAYLTHKIAIRDIHLELEYLNKLDDDSDINNKLIKDKIIELVTEMEHFGSPRHKRANMDEIKILVEISTKDNLMPTFEIKPSDCKVYNLYEVNLKGDIISLHWMSNETLKEKYSLADGMYLVPLLDLIKARKL